MNKEELTPLEALERVEYNLSEDGTSDLDNALHIIETALKESEKALTFYKYCVKNKIDLAKLDQISDDYVAMPKEVWEEKLKKLKALEIIKEKKVHMIWLLCSMTNYKGTNKAQLDSYNAQLDYSAVPHRIKLYLTPEEYELLKEVLKDE